MKSKLLHGIAAAALTLPAWQGVAEEAVSATSLGLMETGALAAARAGTGALVPQDPQALEIWNKRCEEVNRTIAAETGAEEDDIIRIGYGDNVLFGRTFHATESTVPDAELAHVTGIETGSDGHEFQMMLASGGPVLAPPRELFGWRNGRGLGTAVLIPRQAVPGGDMPETLDLRRVGCIPVLTGDAGTAPAAVALESGGTGGGGAGSLAVHSASPAHAVAAGARSTSLAAGAPSAPRIGGGGHSGGGVPRGGGSAPVGGGGGGGGGSSPVVVPEIDASSGLLAIAAILAGLLFAWERRRPA